MGEGKGEETSKGVEEAEDTSEGDSGGRSAEVEDARFEEYAEEEDAAEEDEELEVPRRRSNPPFSPPPPPPSPPPPPPPPPSLSFSFSKVAMAKRGK